MKLLSKDQSFSQNVKKWQNTPWANLALAVVTIIIISLIWWRLSIIYENYLVDQKRIILQGEVEEIANNLTSSVNRRQALLIGTVAFVKTHSEEELRNGQYNLYAGSLSENDPTIRAIQYFPPSGPVLVYPIESNNAIIGTTLDDLKNTKRATADVLRAIESRKITLSNPYELLQGGQGVVARQAVYSDDRFMGLVTVILNLDALLDIPDLSTNTENLNISIKDKTGNIFFGKEDVFTSNPVISQVILPEGYWVIGATSSSSWKTEIRTVLAIFWVIGILLASLSGGITYFISSRQMNLKNMVEIRDADLTESEERFSKIFSASPIAISVTEGLEGKLVEVNDAWCNLMGFAKEESVGQSLEALGIIDKEQGSKLIEYRMSEKSLRLVNSEISIKNGERRKVLLSAETFTMRADKFVINLMVDITERRLAEEEAHRLKANLEKRVAERTAELSGLVSTMAGREVRMAELKEVIRQLRGQLEQSGLTPVADDPLAEL